MKRANRLLSATKTSQDILLISIVVVFFLGLLPPAASFVFYSAFPEHHYTDAAIPMFHSHDLLTPVQHDGSVRLIKPPLTYWLMIGTYKLFGVSALSCRLIFLLGGCATIWLAYLVAFKLTADKRAARLTALILLSHPLIIAVSIRSLPDILLTFWILLSGYGFIRLICLNDVQSISYWTAYGGVAMAIETKGLLGILLLAYALVFAFVTASADRPFRSVINVKIMVVALLIAGAGFLLMFWKHGDAFLQSFWGDQVGQKLDLGVGHFALKIVGFLTMYLVSFLPWLLCLGYFFVKGKPRSPLSLPQQRSSLFIAGWALLLPIAFSWGNLLSLRYVLPSIPFLAVAIAVYLCRFSESALSVVLDLQGKILTVCFFAIAIFGLRLFQETSFTNYFVVLAVLLLVILFVALHWQKRRLSAAARFSFSYFLFWPLVFSIACPFKLPDESVAIAHELEAVSPAKSSLMLVVDDHDLSVGLASRVRIASGGAYPVYRFESLPENIFSRLDQSLLILCESQARLLSPGSFQLRRIGSGLNELAWTEFITATLKGDAKSYLAGRIEYYYTATPVRRTDDD